MRVSSYLLLADQVNGMRSSLFIKNAGELRLSGTALVGILRAVLAKGVRFKFQANGFSMSPFIKDGDVITVCPVYEKSIRPGDVGAFVRSHRERMVVHRIVGDKGNYFTVMGDNTRHSYELISKENILGRVTSVDRNGKKVSLGLGPERHLISFLNRRGLLFPLLSPLRKLLHPLSNRLTP